MRQRRPTLEERDERVILPPEEAIPAILAAGPHEDEDDPSRDDG